MKKYSTLILICLIVFDLEAGFDPYARGGRAASMSNSSVVGADFWGVFNNQASMAWRPKMGMGAFFENRYGINELNARGIGVELPVASSDVFGLAFTQFGYTAYSETKAGLSFAKAFADKVAAGLQLDYLHIASNIENGNKGVFTFELGLQSKVSRKMTIGFYVFNPIRSVFSNYNGYPENVPVVMRFGIAYRFSEKFILEVETEKDLDHDAVLRGGGDYSINDKFFVRGGFSTGVVSYSIGMGTKWNGLTLDIASSFHQVLGVTPTLSLNYEFAKFHLRPTSSH